MYRIKTFNDKEDGQVYMRETLAEARKLARRELRDNKKVFKGCRLTNNLSLKVSEIPCAKLEDDKKGIVFYVSIWRYTP